MRRSVVAAAVAAMAPFPWGLSFTPPGPPEGTGSPPREAPHIEFSILPFPSGAVRIMFYVLVGIIILFGANLVGLVFYRGRDDD